MKSFLFTALITLVSIMNLNAQKLENSTLWKIEGNGLEKASYLFGTIHITCDATIEDDVKKWAMADKTIRNVEEPTTDCNGAELFAGDNVTLTKDLYIKGANFTAKRGTLIKGISLTDNSYQIEGNISGTRTVLAGKYLKKA